MNAVTQESRTAMQVVEHDQGELSTTAPQRQSLSTVGPADLLRYALDSGADLDRLEKLMELQERDNANKARMAFVAAMAEFKKNAPTIFKDKNVSHSGISYDHATLGGICEVVIESLARHGISHDWDTKQPESGMIVVSCSLTHVLGHSKSTTMEAPPDNSGKKNGIQQIASTVTYLQRYTLLGACGLATKDMDDDGRGGAQEAPVAVVAAPRPIGPKGLVAAIAQIKAGKFTVARLVKENILTEDQLTQVNDEVKSA
ncbi:single-stranded DNA-binding protein [Janthinobacterium sp. ROICE36]|uniref:ERF family protein n=1 Tax=Janthinobacterium sp. ROICE36 TaxID=2048670 RepID=UPI000C7F1D8D|nr:ERF family protein [Janthinobacterium sp. ROICE36]PLY41677.1 single-stranded DNA-binding protein [Janthinobacterium sp. ROICE36]